MPINDPITPCLELIRAYASEPRPGRYRFAREAGLDETALKYVYRADWNPTAQTMRKLLSVIPRSYGKANKGQRRSSPGMVPPKC